MKDLNLFFSSYDSGMYFLNCTSGCMAIMWKSVGHFRFHFRMDEVRNQSTAIGRFNLIQAWIALLVVFLSLFAYIVKKKFTHCNTVLIVGLCESGKTVLFSKLINPKNDPETYTSLKENSCEVFSAKSDKVVTLVDFPGSERLRKQLFINYFQKRRNSLKGIIFVVDSSTFGKKARDVAAFLYDVLYESKKIPVLVACNKQDCPLAKSSQAVRTALEREFGYINATREAALDSIDGDTKKRALTSTGKNFIWDDLSSLSLDFIECFAREKSEDTVKGCDIEAVQTWIAAL